MLVFYIIPGIVLLMLFLMLFESERDVGILMLITGLLFIPGFTRIIGNTKFRVVPIMKKIITYLPLFAGFAILLYASMGFLGYADRYTIQLGYLIASMRYHLNDAPWASLWPGFAIFLISTSLFVLHEGLAKYSR